MNSDKQDEKKAANGKVKKGFLVVQVGSFEDEQREELQRVVIPIWYLYHPLFIGLLDRAKEVYGYHVDGPLRLPCSINDFVHLRWRIEKENGGGSGGRRHQHHHNHHVLYQYFSPAPSFRPC